MPLTPNETLRELRRARGLTQQKLADLIQVSRSTERRWEHGHIQRPHIGQLKNLAHALGVSMDELGFGPINQTVAPRIDVSTELFTPSATSRTLMMMCKNERVERRSFTFLAGTALAAPVGQYLATPSLDPAHYDRPGMRVTDEVVDDLDAFNARLRVLDDWGGGETLLQAVQGQMRLVSDLLNNRSYNAQVGQRLHSNIADLLRTGAWISFDMGQHAQAQQMWITALRAAHTAGDHALGALILTNLSEQAKEINVGDTVPLAEAALQRYRGNNAKVHTLLQLQAAQAYAYSGDSSPARRAIDASFTHWNNANRDNSAPSWTYQLTEPLIHGRGAGFSYYAIGQWALAQQHLHAALLTQEPNTLCCLAHGTLAHTMLAKTYLKQGEIEQACLTVTQALDLFGADINRSRQARTHIDYFTRQISDYQSSPAVRVLMDRTHSLTVGNL
jgi:transcriptional regulator with XRE-family HTH domain